MRPSFVTKPEMNLVGILGCAADVSQLDMCGLWGRLDGHVNDIKHQVEGKSYEIHIQERGSPVHFCLVGVEVQRIEDLPVELFVKVVPACEYAVFTRKFGDGGYDDAFKAVYKWIENSDYTRAYQFDVQCYDSSFNHEDPESVFEMYVPVTPRQR